MNNKTVMDIQRNIDIKRIEMLEEAKKHGMNSEEVLKISKELDALIIEYMKKQK